MSTVVELLQYFGAGLVGLVIAILPTALVSYAILPPDGPIGVGFIIILIYLISCCACVPGYIVLMTRYRQGRRDTRKLIASEIILRTSVIVAACFICFMIVRLPTAMVTKWVACLAAMPAGVWAIKPDFLEIH